MKVLGLVPARAASKGVPQKNLRPLAGRPLLAWTKSCIDAAGALDRTILSTESEEIAALGRACGLEVPFIRPQEHSTDTSPMLDVVLHALDELARTGYRPDAVMVLQPTSPLRRPAHIQRAIELLPGADAVCSVSPLPKDLCPHYLVKLDEDGFMGFFMPDGANFTRRQDVPQAWRRDGTIFLTRVGVLHAHRSFYGHRCRTFEIPWDEVLNIDEPADWAEAERRLAAAQAATDRTDGTTNE